MIRTIGRNRGKERLKQRIQGRADRWKNPIPRDTEPITEMVRGEGARSTRGFPESGSEAEPLLRAPGRSGTFTADAPHRQGHTAGMGHHICSSKPSASEVSRYSVS